MNNLLAKLEKFFHDSNYMNSDGIIVRSKVTPKANYRDYREDLRIDFWFSCGYCSITEIESWGIGFQIDHYCPRTTHPALIADYKNLMYSCERCNQYKGDYSPNEQGFERGLVILRPDSDDPRDYMDLVDEKLKGKDITGEFNIEKLYLNRKQLVILRQLRKKLSEANEFIAFGIRQLLGFRLDQIRRDKRVLFLKLQKQIQQRKRELDSLTAPMLKEFAHSRLLDEDPEKKEGLKRRREFLKDKKAIIP